jgi:hypothetical protein
MSEVLLSVFRKEVMPYVPAAPEMVVDNAVRNACIEFCNDTHWVIYEHPLISLVADIASYDYTLPDDMEVARVISVYNEGRLLKASTEHGMKRTPDWRNIVGDPTAYLSDDLHELRLIPIPEVATTDTLAVVMALKPTRTANVVPSDLYDIWAETIAYGARARICEIPMQAYSDLNVSAMCRTQFTAGRNKAKIERNRGLTAAPTRVRFPGFY